MVRHRIVARRRELIRHGIVGGNRFRRNLVLIGYRHLMLHLMW